MSPPTARAGFARPADCRRPTSLHRALMAQLITTGALVVSIAVAVTALSIGIARADALTPVDHYGARVAAATIGGLALVAMGGLTAVVVHERSRKARQD